MKGEKFLDWLRHYQFLKEDSATFITELKMALFLGGGFRLKN